jgi:hypothetical protein
MEGRVRKRIISPLTLRDVSLCGAKVKLPDGRQGELLSANGKQFKVLINNKNVFIDIPADYLDWIVIT